MKKMATVRFFHMGFVTRISIRKWLLLKPFHYASYEEKSKQHRKTYYMFSAVEVISYLNSSHLPMSLRERKRTEQIKRKNVQKGKSNQLTRSLTSLTTKWRQLGLKQIKKCLQEVSTETDEIHMIRNFAFCHNCFHKVLASPHKRKPTSCNNFLICYFRTHNH